MLPNIDLRISNIIKAMEQVLLPALPADQRLARDQAMLIIGQLSMIADQWKHAAAYERLTLDDLRGLATQLLPAAQGPAKDALTQQIAATDNCDANDVDALESANIALGRAVDAVILGDDGTHDLPAECVEAILAYGDRHAHAERIWFKGNRLDPDQKDLPEIEELLAEGS